MLPDGRDGAFAATRASRRRDPVALFDPRRVALDLWLADKQDALHEIGRLVQETHGPRAAEVTGRLARRESLGSTVVCPGIAVPHANVPGLAAAMAIYLRPQTAIVFDDIGSTSVLHILALIVPRPATAAHFELLRRVTHRMADPALSRHLERCRCAQSACDELQQAMWA